MLYRLKLPWAGFELTTLVVIGTDYIASCKSHYHDGPKFAEGQTTQYMYDENKLNKINNKSSIKVAYVNNNV